MRLITHIYKDPARLEQLIQTHQLSASPNILVQIFSSRVDVQINLNLSQSIKALLPECHIIGTTTAGEILHGKMYEDKIVIAFAVFDHTRVRSNVYPQMDEYDCANQMMNDLVDEDTKAIIIFSDGLRSNGEELLKQITKVRPDIVVAGGRAGDYHAFANTLVFNERLAMENGVVAASISGKELIIHNHYMLNWQTIGEPMTITNADKNHLFEINGVPAKEIYTKYLGIDISSALPESGIEFPLIFRRGGIDVARAPIAVFEDGSLLFGGNIDEGEQVRFGFGNLDMVREKSFDDYNFFKTLPVEGTFIYSCSARKALLGTDLEKEFDFLEALAPTVGYFTYGEYFHSLQINELLNITTTFLSVSETTKVSNLKTIDSVTKSESNRALNALSHLVSVTSKELQDLNHSLQEKIAENEKVNASLKEGQRIARFGIGEWDMINDHFWWSDGIYMLFGLEAQEFAETYDEYLKYIHPDDRMMINEALDTAIKTHTPYAVRHRIIRADKEELTVEAQGEILYDEENRPVFMKGTIKDVTEFIRTQQELEAYKNTLEQQVESEITKRRQQEEMLIQQSRLAAMGEMVGNIAHQWRQPLNALSLVIGNLEDMFETGEFDEESISKCTEKSYTLIDKMSATIDDFRNFFSPDKSEQIFAACEVIEDTVSLLEASLRHNQIDIRIQHNGGTQICGYKNELSQVLLNIINNARDALMDKPESRLIEVIEEATDKEVLIHVKDNAGGIPEEIISRIFEPYFTTKEQGKGTGIGLYMSKTIIEEHMHGKLSVHNDQDGAVFTISIPRKKEMP